MITKPKLLSESVEEVVSQLITVSGGWFTCSLCGCRTMLTMMVSEHSDDCDLMAVVEAAIEGQKETATDNTDMTKQLNQLAYAIVARVDCGRLMTVESEHDQSACSLAREIIANQNGRRK